MPEPAPSELTGPDAHLVFLCIPALFLARLSVPRVAAQAVKLMVGHLGKLPIGQGFEEEAGRKLIVHPKELRAVAFTLPAMFVNWGHSSSSSSLTPAIQLPSFRRLTPSQY